MTIYFIHYKGYRPITYINIYIFSIHILAMSSTYTHILSLFVFFFFFFFFFFFCFFFLFFFCFFCFCFFCFVFFFFSKTANKKSKNSMTDHRCFIHRGQLNPAFEYPKTSTDNSRKQMSRDAQGKNLFHFDKYMLCVFLKIYSPRQFQGARSTYHHLIGEGKDINKSSTSYPWTDATTNTQRPEPPTSGTTSQGPKDARAIEVRRYTKSISVLFPLIHRLYLQETEKRTHLTSL